MAHSSPEGIILGKGSTLESFSLSINKEKVLELKQQERSYSEEEVGELLYNVIGEYGKYYRIRIDGKVLNDLFEQFKKK